MITLTETASNQVKSQIEKRGKGLGIRVGVKTTGCSGLAYTLEFVDNFQIDDFVLDCNNVQIFVDKKSSHYLNGLTIDYVKKGLNEGFEFNNPLEKGRCGCGESFRV